MKKSAIIYLSLLCLYILQVQAQTAPIAYKSHSGAGQITSNSTEGEFGNPPDQLVKIIKLNDSMVIEVKDSWSSNRGNYQDTVWNHPVFSDPKYNLPDLQKMYPHLDFEGFESKNKEKSDTLNPNRKYRKHRQRKHFQGSIESPSSLPSRHLAMGIVGVFALCGLGAFAHYRYANRKGDA